MFKKLAWEVRLLVDAYLGKSRKVLVLDLDNTLWGGVVGEVGINGIQLSEDGEGKIFRDFQKEVQKLLSLGVLLCVASKNNYTDAMEAIKTHSMMVLKEKDFVCFRINWNSKVQSLMEIADELSLGLDSFVFIDDNPVERELIRSSLPAVAVPDFASDKTSYKRWFIENVAYRYFLKLKLIPFRG